MTLSANAEKVHRLLAKRNARLKFKEIVAKTALSTKQVDDAIYELRAAQHRLAYAKFDKTYFYSESPTWYSEETDLSRVLPVEGTIGLISDTHLCSVAERLDVVNDAYDAFKARGITHVFHTGDISDGWQEYRNHISFVKAHGDQDQAAYVIKHYPKREGITTYVIGGNHDDSYGKSKVDRVSLVVHGFQHQGKVIKGRDDIKYLGPYNHYVRFPQEVIMQMLHPRGGNAYAKSYRQQKRSEEMDPNRRPDLQVSGHYHTWNYIWLVGTHFLALPGMQDETEFFVRLGYPRSVGYTILTYKIEKGRFAFLSPELYMVK